MTAGTIRVGIGGWIYPPWRGVFYPQGLPRAQELAYAAAHLTSIEINATFHRTQTPDSFHRWRQAVPDGFVFSLKAPRSVTWRRTLADAAPSIARFLASGVTELGPPLGSILWQLPPTRRFDAAALEPFLALLPHEHDGLALRHALEAPHESFADPAVAPLLRRFGIAWAMVDADGYPQAEPTARFIYARLKRSSADAAEGYDAARLRAWHGRLRAWARANLDCYIYFIGGEKVRAPLAASAMLARLRKHEDRCPALAPLNRAGLR